MASWSRQSLQERQAKPVSTALPRIPGLYRKVIADEEFVLGEVKSDASIDWFPPLCKRGVGGISWGQVAWQDAE